MGASTRHDMTSVPSILKWPLNIQEHSSLQHSFSFQMVEAGLVVDLERPRLAYRGVTRP